MKTFRSLKVQFLSGFLGFLVIFSGLFVSFTIKDSISDATKILIDQAMPILLRVVDAVDGDSFEELSKTYEGNEFYYYSLYSDLYVLKQNINCSYLYTMAPVSGSIFKYIVDASTTFDDVDNFFPYGKEEDITTWGDAPFKTINTKKMTTTKIVYQEGWGFMLSVYLPIINSHDKVVGIIGCDFDAQPIRNTIQARIIKISIISLALSFLGFLFVLWFSRIFFTAIKTVGNAMNNIAQGEGDLTRTVPVNRKDEIGELATACNAVIYALHQIMASIKKSIGNLTKSGESVSEQASKTLSVLENTEQDLVLINNLSNDQHSIVETIYKGIQVVETEINLFEEKINNQTQAVSQSSAAIEEIAANIKSVNQTVETINNEYVLIVKETDNGRSAQEDVSEKIQAIVNHSQDLQEANTVINEIASKTNLLAMNAAIEAAHAGDAGKGFSVVADEIRALAETSSEQTKLIGSVLQTITQAINNIVDASKLSTSSFESLGIRIKNLHVLMDEVRSAMNEQSIGAADILHMMETVDESSKDLSEASNRMHSTSTQVFPRMDELKHASVRVKEKSSHVTESVSRIKDLASLSAQAAQENEEITIKIAQLIQAYKTN